MADWEKLREATFRGVPFYLVETEGESGRRAIPRAYPNKEVGWTEDNGAVLGGQQITGMLVGTDYQRRLEALLTALNTPGPGELIHPWYGPQTVQIGKVTHKLSTQDGGIANVTFEVHEAGERLFPSASENTSETVISAADSVKQALENGDFFGALDGAGDMLDTWLNDIDELIKNFPTVPTVLSDWTDRAGRMRGMLDVLTEKPAAFIREALDLVSGVSDVVSEPLWAMHVYDQLFSMWNGRRAEQAALRTLKLDVFTRPPDVENRIIGFASSVPASVIRSTQAMQDNAADFQQMVLIAALVSKALTLAGMDFSDSEKYLDNALALTHSSSGTGGGNTFSAAADILDAGDFLAAQLSEQAVIAVENGQRNIWRTLRHLRFAVINDVRMRAAQLPELRNISVSRTTAVALLAWRETGDTEKRNNIVSRNRLRDPSFILPSQTIEVNT